MSRAQASNAKQKLSRSIDLGGGGGGLPANGGRLSEACIAKARHVADLLHVTLAALTSNDELVKAREVRSLCTRTASSRTPQSAAVSP